MTEFKYHSALRITEDKPEWNPELPFELKLAFELGNLDISLVNGLRRVVFADVPSVAIGPDVELDVAKNITVFNSQYLQDRFAMQPIHLDKFEDLSNYKNSGLIFKIADPNDWNKSLDNPNNFDKHITTGDLIALEKIQEPVAPGNAVPASGIAEEAPVLTQPTGEEDVAKNELEANAEFVAEANAQEELLAGEVASTANPGIGAEPGAEEVAPSQDADLKESQQEVALSMEAMKRMYRKRDPKEFFTFQETYLATLKKGESLYSVMKPQIGTGKDHARWQAGLITYRFKPKNPEVLDDPSKWNTSEYKPIRGRQDYPTAEGTIPGQYGTPQRFEMSVEYTGHYRPALTWLLTIQALRQKIERFQSDVRQINGQNGKITDNLTVDFSSKDMVPNLVTLTVLNEDHTLGNIVFSHYLYALQQFVQNVAGDSFKEDILKGFSHYRVPHPLDNKLIIMLRVPDWSMAQLKKGFNSILLPGENPYDDAFYQSSPTIRLLMIVLERVLGVLKDLEHEGNRVLELASQNKITVQLIAPKLPQAPLKETAIEAGSIEYKASVLLEEQELVGVAEEGEEEDKTQYGTD